MDLAGADPFPDVPPDLADPDRPVVRVGDPGDLVAGLPALLGYHPRESLVLIGLGGASGRRVGLVARADLPAPEHARPLAASLAGSIATTGPRAALAVLLSDAPAAGGLPHRALVHELVVALDARGLPLTQALLARSGRWWDYDCPELCCTPGAGTPVPTGTGELAVAAVAAGTVVAPDRAALAERIAPPGESARAAMQEAVLRTVPDRIRRPAARRRIAAAVAGYRPGRDGGRLDDDEIARIAWSLRDGETRDWALLLSLGEDERAAEALWTECTRRAPAPLDAGPAALVALGAWLRGDGAMANIALDRALDSDPGNHLARLLQAALAAFVPPSQLRELLAEAGRDAGTAERAGAEG